MLKLSTDIDTNETVSFVSLPVEWFASAGPGLMMMYDMYSCCKHR